jgi:hypothetical protein
VVVYYEDYPYAEKPGATQAVLRVGRWREELLPLSPEALEARIAAVACYGSQLGVLGWADAMEMATAVRAFAGRAFAGRAFAERIGGGVPAERYWRPMI